MRFVMILLSGIAVSWSMAPQSATGSDAAATSARAFVCPPCGCSKDGVVFDQAGTCPDCHMPLIERTTENSYNVAIVVHDGVELLDFAGPGEVFAAASLHNGGSDITFNVYTVAPSADMLISQGFVDIKPRYTIDNCPEPDILMIPGGRTGVLTNDPKFMTWAKRVTDKAKHTLTVCTGAFVVGANGQLDGLEATTHHGAIAGLRESFPKTKVLENRRFIDNGKIITTAGVSAGIDGALHLVARLMNFSAAKDTARYMEYDWTARELTKAMLTESQHNDATRRDNRDAAFKSAYETIHSKQWADAVVVFKKMTSDYPSDKECWYYLGLAHHKLENWVEGIRANEEAAKLTGYVPHRPVYNIACAYARLGHADYALNALETAITLGMTDKDAIENDPDLASVRSEARYQEMIKGLGQ